MDSFVQIHIMHETYVVSILYYLINNEHDSDNKNVVFAYRFCS